MAIGEVLGMVIGTASVAVMEVVDNAIMLLIPGAMELGATDPGFWGALAVALLIAGVVAYPANRWLLARGAGTPWCISTARTEPPQPRAKRRRG